MQYQGPLPPPQLMREYNDLVPGGAERIFAVFEKQVEHRHLLERTVVQGNNRRADRGFWAALMLALIVVLGGFALAFLGKSLAGLAAIIIALASLVAVFITGRRHQAGELAEKADRASPQPADLREDQKAE